jgi:hypothetical protein
LSWSLMPGDEAIEIGEARVQKLTDVNKKWGTKDCDGGDSGVSLDWLRLAVIDPSDCTLHPAKGIGAPAKTCFSDTTAPHSIPQFPASQRGS